MRVLQLLWLGPIMRGILLICQNTTMRVYGARIKRYCVLCSKHIAVRVVLSYLPAGSRQAAWWCPHLWDWSIAELSQPVWRLSPNRPTARSLSSLSSMSSPAQSMFHCWSVASSRSDRACTSVYSTLLVGYFFLSKCATNTVGVKIGWKF